MLGRKTDQEFEPSLIDRMRADGVSPSRTIFVRATPKFRRVWLSAALRALIQGEDRTRPETVAVYLHSEGVLIERVKPETPASMIFTVSNNMDAIHCKEVSEKLPQRRRVLASSVNPETGSAVFLFDPK